MKKHLTVQNITKMALMAALLCMAAYISIPIGSVPITLQTLIINLTALILAPFEAFFAVLVYILLGLVGLPVFAGGTAGPGKLFGPTGGYILAFLISAPIISILKESLLKFFEKISKSNNKKIMRITCYILSTVIGMIIMYAIGTVYMKYMLDQTLMETLAVAVIPFIGLDLIKCILATIIALILEKALKR